MIIKIKCPLDNNSYTDARLPALALFVVIIGYGNFCLRIDFQNFRQSIFLLSRPNMTLADWRSLCNIPFDEYRCSVISNKFNNSTKCIKDIDAMTAHILPLVSYMLQLYFIYELFSIKGSYSHILTDIFWIVALFVFVIIAIGVHGSTCLHALTNDIIYMTGVAMFGFVMFLHFYSDEYYSSYERRNTYRYQRLVKNNYDDETMTAVIVS